MHRLQRGRETLKYVRYGGGGRGGMSGALGTEDWSRAGTHEVGDPGCLAFERSKHLRRVDGCWGRAWLGAGAVVRKRRRLWAPGRGFRAASTLESPLPRPGPSGKCG